LKSGSCLTQRSDYLTICGLFNAFEAVITKIGVSFAVSLWQLQNRFSRNLCNLLKTNYKFGKCKFG